MTDPQPIELSPAGAGRWIHTKLAQAEAALGEDDVEGALDAYVQALGLALQLGPAPTEQVLSAILDGAVRLARRQDADGLSAMGPALVGLTGQMREAKALPRSVQASRAAGRGDTGTQAAGVRHGADDEPARHH